MTSNIMTLERLHLDRTLLYALLSLCVLSVFVIYSASAKDVGATVNHIVRLLVGLGVLTLCAQLRPETLARWSPYVYGIGLFLLLVVLTMGAVSKGAQRWIDLGFTKFQPSEIMKLGVPMMLAWYMARGNLPPRLAQIGTGLAIALVPAVLVIRQPDLGTGILIFVSGVVVLFLAGMSMRVILAALALAAAAAPVMWNLLRDYQRDRILTLLDPNADPLGTGYHTLQSMIALGSGGFFGKGWKESTQAHLEYLPESKTDFIFAVFGEEFGLIGILLLLAVYGFIALRAMTIAFYAQDNFSRLLAGAIGVTFFLYFFINVGMVAGILPVVGVPLPLLSYGGSSLVVLMAMFGVLMSIHTHRRIVAT
jgi:rod shape determining protein RodA